MFSYIYFGLIMHVSIFILVYLPFLMMMILFISPLVLALLSRMVLQSVRCIIYWRQPVLSPFICISLSPIGVMRF